ncbi:hypothetical protein B0H11DRAFT_2259557 [Mycena galericulata]|nr:hypothetical protein B0H11DRAFT_2259557 [Mycena galericulata]
MTDPPDTHSPPSHASTTPIHISNLPRNLISDTEAVPGTPAEANENGNPVNVTFRTRRSRQREVPPLPTDTTVITPPRQQPRRKEKDADTPLAPPSPHRPAPQIRIETRQARGKNSKALAKDANSKSAPLPEVTVAPGTRAERSDAHGTRGGAHQASMAQDELPPRADRQDTQPAPPVTSDAPKRTSADKPPGKKRDSAKKDKYAELEHAAETAQTFDALAETFAEMVATMKLYKAAPTKQCFSLLECIQERLTNHHTFPREDESHKSFSTVLSRSVKSPVASLTAQVDAQQRAIQSLTKSVESLKNAPLFSAPAASASYAAAAASPSPKRKPAPLPNPSDERILVRFHGVVPPILSLPYPEILSSINACLAKLKLPMLMYTQKHSESGIFVVPATKEDLRVLLDKWDSWAPLVLPGGSIAPVATHCFLQVDGIPFAGAGTLDELHREFEERNPQLGLLFIRLEDRGMVDKAVAGKWVILAGTAPAVGRGFPHLRIVQCWGCLKFGHTRVRCSVTEPRCAGCGKDAHGVVCPEKPSCINCGGAHRADNFICPSRKWIAEQL